MCGFSCGFIQQNFGFNRIWCGCNRNPKHNCCSLGIAILDDDEWWLPMIVPHILGSNHQPTWFCESQFLQLGVELGSAQFSRPAWSPFQKVKHSSTELSKCSKRVKKEISYGNGFVLKFKVYAQICRKTTCLPSNIMVSCRCSCYPMLGSWKSSWCGIHVLQLETCPTMSNAAVSAPAPLEPRSLKDIDLAGLARRALLAVSVHSTWCIGGLKCQIPNWMVRMNKSNKQNLCVSRGAYTQLISIMSLTSSYAHCFAVTYILWPIHLFQLLPCLSQEMFAPSDQRQGNDQSRSDGKCSEIRIKMKNYWTFGNHPKQRNHTGIAWRIFLESIQDLLWIQPFLTWCWSQRLLPTSNPCLLHWPCADHVPASVGRQTLVISRCEYWSSATNIWNPEVHALWSWAKEILGVRNAGSSFNKVSRSSFFIFQLSPDWMQTESFHV